MNKKIISSSNPRKEWEGSHEETGNASHVVPHKKAWTNIKRFAVQDLGEETVLWASYRGRERNPDHTTLFYPFYPTDYGRCSLIHPMIAFNKE